MIPIDADEVDRRVLVLTPTSRDASLTLGVLTAAGIAATFCASFDALLARLEDGAAAILVPEEAMSADARSRLAAIVAAQPAWSDLPVLVLTRRGSDFAASSDPVRTLGNVTLLERPMHMTTLLSVVRTALRARARQFQIRGYIEERARAEESLRQADQRKDEFLATLGHELRNPLAPLLAGLQLLKASGVDDPRVVRVTGVMERQITHLVRLVDDLLEVSRITRGLVDLQREPVDLASVVRLAVETSRPVLDAAGHRLTLDLPTEAVTVSGDAVRLTQVFANLLTNAAKYTNAGGNVWLTVARTDQRASVSVRDDGIGIPHAHLASVFDMFMQVDRSNRRAQGGLGIGLTLVRSMVAMHGGRVHARSAGPGQGTEFVVELPVLADSVTTSGPATPLERLPPRRVLVVDDNVDAAETLAALLGSLGATVSVVNSGIDALEALGAFTPDAVLLDIGMPEMDGYEVARRMRAAPGHRNVLLIALTGWGQDQDYARSRAAGFDHHLVKPPDMVKLHEMLVEGRPAGRRPDTHAIRSTST